MRTIEIDDEVYAYLQNKAIPYEEQTPNQTLRRLLELDGTGHSQQKSASSENDVSSSKRVKRRKTDLRELIDAGLLREGQSLRLHDYRGNKVSGYEAQISGKRLMYNGSDYSMSELAKVGMQEAGYDSNSYRGPKHWYTSSGVSVKNLWEQYLGRSE